jgi:N,N-dimethylformamidase
MSMEVFLAGYTDRLSGRPGDTIRFHVSSKSSGNVSARLVRSICCDPNPEGPGVIEQDASEWCAPTEFPSRHQPIVGGSCAMTQESLQFPPDDSSVQVDLWLYSTARTCQESKNQCVWSWGDVSLSLNPEGRIVVSFPTTTIQEPTPIILTTSYSVSLRKWYHCSVTMDFSQNSCRVVIRNHHHLNEIVCSESSFLPLDCVRPRQAPFSLATGGTFNGKLEAPRITVDGGRVLASWDTSQNISGWTVPCQSEVAPASNASPLILYHHPTRAIKGQLWDGTELCWRHQPSHYGAIYFHEDDGVDFGWGVDLEWTIPPTIPSGIYLMRLSVEEEGHEEALPLFVCPPLQRQQQRDKKICILISTFTYVMYGNHARSDFQPSWLDRIREWKAYPHNPSQYPKYGCSTYNFHADGSGIGLASHRRPLFNLRPQYSTFGDSTCSGLRHFPADSHLIAWMHHQGLDYDIVTDHELHKDGVAAICGYQTLMTGTHPEYHSLETLNALQAYRDDEQQQHGGGGNLIYLGGNGFYWRVAAQDSDASLLEIRRAEDGVRTWASEPGEYYHALDGTYGGLWRRNDRPPQRLVGVGFTAQGSFVGMPYQRVCFDAAMDWVFQGIQDSNLLGDFGLSGHGAAGFELDRVDRRLDGEEHNVVILAQSHDKEKKFMLVPEEVLTTYSSLSGLTSDEARRADMVYFRTSSGAQVFSVGSITFCGSLPWNNFDNNISTLLKNVIQHFTSD